MRNARWSCTRRRTISVSSRRRCAFPFFTRHRSRSRRTRRYRRQPRDRRRWNRARNRRGGRKLIFFLAILGLPIAYLVVLVILLFRREPRGAVLSVLFAAAALMSAVWAMDQSRSSTRGLAFLGFPLLA